MRRWWRRPTEREERTEAFWRAVGRGEPLALNVGAMVPPELALVVARDADLFYELVVSNWAMRARTSANPP